MNKSQAQPVPFPWPPAGITDDGTAPGLRERRWVREAPLDGLRRSHVALTKAHGRDSLDLAGAGCLTLTRAGQIVEIDLIGARPQPGTSPSSSATRCSWSANQTTTI
jgi:hypothetical protein